MKEPPPSPSSARAPATRRGRRVARAPGYDAVAEAFVAGARDPRCSPLLEADLTGLPPAVITTADLDPLRDQGARYAEALRAAGVAVRYTNWDGHMHATMMWTALADSTWAYEVECNEGIAELRAMARVQR